MPKLTDVIEKDEFKETVSSLEKPIWDISPVSVDPIEFSSSDYPLAGTAFDYLIRFQIEKENPNKTIYTPDKLIAEKAVELLDSSEDPRRPLTDKEKGEFKSALLEYKNYVSKGGEPPVEAALTFAKLDPIFRTKHVSTDDIDLCSAKSHIKSDLITLLSISEQLWEVDEYAVLNPPLGVTGLGADADLIIDGELIDIKTTVNPKFTNNQWHQLIGYLTLLDIRSGDIINGGWTVEKPEKAGIYYSRSGDYQTFDSDKVYSYSDLSDIRDVLYMYSVIK